MNAQPERAADDLADLMNPGVERLTDLSVVIGAAIAALEAAERRGVALTATILEDEGFSLIINRGDGA